MGMVSRLISILTRSGGVDCANMHLFPIPFTQSKISMFTPRNGPIFLRPKVKKKLTRMKKMGVISMVTEPTSWCAGMVVVAKLSGAVRVCLKNLNQSVLREPHSIPAVDDSLAHLTGAPVFSKVDANSGFRQIPPVQGDPSSHRLADTTSTNSSWHLQCPRTLSKSYESLATRS